MTLAVLRECAGRVALTASAGVNDGRDDSCGEPHFAGHVAKSVSAEEVAAPLRDVAPVLCATSLTIR
jgi:hypothetical protein